MVDAMKKPETWPRLLDMTKDECKMELRSLELDTYSQVVSVFRAQGELTKEKRKLLHELQSLFSISLERHRAEVRRVTNDEKLNTIAENLAGPNTSVEWAIESRRLIPLLRRAPPQNAYAAIASHMAQIYCNINSTLKHPSKTAKFGKFENLGAVSDETDSESETEGLRFIDNGMVPSKFVEDHGTFTTLPRSQERLAKAKGLTQTGPSNLHVIPDKRKRKRSFSTDLPPRPPHPTPLGSSSASNLQQPLSPIKAVSVPKVSGSAVKVSIPVTPSRNVSAASTSAGHSQKVILVSTSGISNSPSAFQRSISVPHLKGSSSLLSSNQTSGMSRSVSAGPGAMSGSSLLQGCISSSTSDSTSPPLTSSVSMLHGSSAERVQHQGPTGTPVNASLRRQRISTIHLHPESSTISKDVDSYIGGSVAIPANSSLLIGSSSNVVSVNPSQILSSQTVQVRPSSIASSKGFQIRHDSGGSKVIAHSILASAGSSASNNLVGGSVSSLGGATITRRVLGRPGLSSPVVASQGPVYVVPSGSTGPVTLVTRTIATGQATVPRVVTVNTVTNPKTSVATIRAPSSPANMATVGTKTVRLTSQGGLRPTLSTGKSNVIVVQRTPFSQKIRQVGVQNVKGTLLSSSNTNGIATFLPGGVISLPAQSPKTLSSSSGICTNSSVQTSHSGLFVLDVRGDAGASPPLDNVLTATSGVTSTSIATVPTTKVFVEPSNNISVQDSEVVIPVKSNSTLTSSKMIKIPLGSSSMRNNNSVIKSSQSQLSNNSLSVLNNTVTTSVSDSNLELKVAENKGVGWLPSDTQNSGITDLEESDSSNQNQSIPEKQMKMLEEAVEFLGRGDKEMARNLLLEAGIELLDSPSEGEPSTDTTSAPCLMDIDSQTNTEKRLSDVPIPPVGDLDPTTGLFYDSHDSVDSNENSRVTSSTTVVVQPSRVHGTEDVEIDELKT